jgi:hypothetical protein
MFGIVCIGWVFFRAESIGDAWHVLAHSLSVEGLHGVQAPEVVAAPTLWALIIGLCAAEWLYRHSQQVRAGLVGDQWAAIAGRYALFAAIIVSAGASQLEEARPFIYFQF